MRLRVGEEEAFGHKATLDMTTSNPSSVATLPRSAIDPLCSCPSKITTETRKRKSKVEVPVLKESWRNRMHLMCTGHVDTCQLEEFPGNAGGPRTNHLWSDQRCADHEEWVIAHSMHVHEICDMEGHC